MRAAVIISNQAHPSPTDFPAPCPSPCRPLPAHRPLLLPLLLPLAMAAAADNPPVDTAPARPPPSASVSASSVSSHWRYMGMALEQARLALEWEEVPVGCVFVDERSDEVIARAFNRTNLEKNVSCNTAPPSLSLSLLPLSPLTCSPATPHLHRRRVTASSSASTTSSSTRTGATVS